MQEQRLRPSTAVRASVSSDGLVLLDIDGGVVLASNAIGARIWQLIEHQHTAQEIAGRLVEDYGIPVERAQRDVVAFLAALLGRGLVTGEPRS